MKTKGSVYQVPKKCLAQFHFYNKLDCLADPEVKFITALLELAFEKNENDTSIETSESDDVLFSFSKDELKKQLLENKSSCSDTLIKTRSKALHKLGVFKLNLFKRDKSKSAHLYTLQLATKLTDIESPNKKNYTRNKDQRGQLKALRTQLIETNAQVLDTSIPIKLARSERLWNGVFGACMRTSRNDPRKKEPFLTIYGFGKGPVRITTSTQTDSEICHVDDQRTILAIITLVCYTISGIMDAGGEVKNDFFIDIVELCNLMGLDGSGANRETVRQSLKRLYTTNFNLELDQDSEGGRAFASHFGLSFEADEQNFRFLTEMDHTLDAEYGGSSVRKPRWYRIALHSKTFKDLIDPSVISTFVNNPQMLKASSGLILLFHTWCSINVKRSGNFKRSVSLNELQKKMIPSARYDNFKKRFLVSLRRHQKLNGENWNDTGPNRMNIYGYIIEAEPNPVDDWIFSVIRDKKDHVIGDKSLHNKLLESHKKGEHIQHELEV